MPLLKPQWLRGRLPATSALAAGVLIGDSFLHLLPDAFATHMSGERVAHWMLAGFLAFFFIECVLRYLGQQAGGDNDHRRSVVLVRMDILGDLAHHALDGLLIGGAFLASTGTGLIMAVAIAVHEIVRKFGVAGVLVANGVEKTRALRVVWVDTLVVPVATMAMLLLARNTDHFGPILATSGGAALYLACCDFLPSAWLSSKKESTLEIALALPLGIIAIWLCGFFERVHI